MAKAAITKKYALSATGILDVNEDGVAIENPDTGDMIELAVLLKDFANRPIKLSVTYDEDYS